MSDLTESLSSALLLGNDAPLRVGNILALRVELRLVVLSACETAQPGIALPDEVVSLPTALIQAGAAGVVATGWAVPDAPTAALVVEFYRQWRWERKSPANALADAQRWMRDTTNDDKTGTWQRAVAEKAAWLPPATADMLLDVYLLRDPDALDDSGINVWGGFAHYGR
jgi:CHAT domain-containing protein